MAEQRQFHRVLFKHEALLTINGAEFTTQILDLSLKGALVEKPDTWEIEEATGVTGELRFELAPDEPSIVMNVSLAHQSMLYLGLQCDLIDVDSATLLRRIVELNSSDRSLLQRDISKLIHS